jgi:hypothetical protein
MLQMRAVILRQCMLHRLTACVLFTHLYEEVVNALRNQAADASVCEVPLVRGAVYLIQLSLLVHVRSDSKERQPFQLLHHSSAMTLQVSSASVAWQRTAPERCPFKIIALPLFLRHAAEVYLLHGPVAEIDVVRMHPLARQLCNCRSELTQCLYLQQCSVIAVMQYLS